MSFTITSMPTDSADACEQVLRALPDWFGIEEAIIHYRKDIEKMPTWVAVENERIVGFITVNYHNEYSAEIHVMGVLKEFHRAGIGRALVEHIEGILRERNIEYLEVKTLAPSDPNEPYKRTRRFYTSFGFRPLEENKLWGESNPCLIMIKKL